MALLYVMFGGITSLRLFDCKILCDFTLVTDLLLCHNQPDISYVLSDKQDCISYLILLYLVTVELHKSQ